MVFTYICLSQHSYNGHFTELEQNQLFFPFVYHITTHPTLSLLKDLSNLSVKEKPESKET